MVNTNCSQGHFRKALCCKMGKEFEFFLDSAKNPFRKSSPRFWRFQQYVSRLNEAGIGDYLWRQWNEKASDELSSGEEDTDEQNTSMLELDHFEQVIWPFALDLWALSGGLAAFYVWYLLTLAPYLRRHHRDMYDLVNTPLHMFRIVLLFLLTEYYTAMLTSSLGLSQVPFYPTTIQDKPNGPSEESPIQSEVLKILEYFKLIEKTKNIIVLLDAYGVKPTELDLLAKTYHHFGAIDIIYVLLKMKEPVIIRLNDMSTEFVKLSTFAGIEQLFPDRLANMSGRPYKVACLENPPLSFRSPATNRTIGIDVEFVDMIAKHQHTVADYKYSAQPIELFEPWHSTEMDFATYRIILTEQAYKFALLFLPNQYLWCLAVPKTYNRILHQQILWPYTTDMWLLIGTIPMGFEVLDSSMLKLEHFAPIYIVGGYLYLLCVGVFLLEIIIHRILRRLNGR
uniref:Uncharacterized protein n=1 Tax=Anopheles merus TaxID=30066 RepID=A0A182UWY2_ANOME